MSSAAVLDRAKQECQGTTLVEVNPTIKGPTLAYVTEYAQRRVIKYRSNYYDIQLPYVHYELELFPNFGDNGAWYVHGIYFGFGPIAVVKDAFYPCLPNFDKQTPCTAKSEARSGPNIPTIVSNFWNETFGRDGKLAANPSWRKLAADAGKKRGERAAVLEHWETIPNLSTLMHKIHPGSYPRALT